MTTTIHVDMDKPCAKCGQNGATQSGLCLVCATKMGRVLRDDISKVLDAARELIEQHLEERSPDVAQAMGLSEDGTVALGITVKIENAGGGQFTLDVGFRLVKERIRDNKTRIVSTQPTLLQNQEETRT